MTPFNLFIRQCLLYPLTSPFLPPENKVEDGYSYAAGTKTGTLEAGAAGGLPKTGQIIEYRAGDDGTYKKGYPLSGVRFVDNGDGTITDNATGLMWAKDGTGAGCNNGNKKTWNDAIDFCEALDFAEHTDWRLPNYIELASIVKGNVVSPIIDPIFIHTIADYYWTSTNYLPVAGQKYVVRFSTGSIGVGIGTTPYYIRAVRLGA